MICSKPLFGCDILFSSDEQLYEVSPVHEHSFVQEYFSWENNLDDVV